MLFNVYEKPVQGEETFFDDNKHNSSSGRSSMKVCNVIVPNGKENSSAQGGQDLNSDIDNLSDINLNRQ